MSWDLLWKLFLILTLGSYTILVVVVLFGGAKNLKDMFKDLSQPDEKNE